jgi:hypothetical protein
LTQPRYGRTLTASVHKGEQYVTGTEAEYLAGVASSESGLDGRGCDPRTLAVSYCGLTLAPWPRARPRLSAGVIHYPSNASEDAQAFYVAHEIGHDLIAAAGVDLAGDALERACSRIAAALILPRRAYGRDVAKCGWDVCALRKLWPLASPWIHARRLAEIDGAAIASRWRSRRKVERVACDDVAISAAPTATERALARSAFHGNASPDSCCVAWHSAGDRARSWQVDGAAIVLCGIDAL